MPRATSYMMTDIHSFSCIAIASLERPYGTKFTDDLWVEIYAMRELKYQKLMKRAKIVPRPFVRLARRTASPPGLT